MANIKSSLLLLKLYLKQSCFLPQQPKGFAPSSPRKSLPAPLISDAGVGANF
jgi:hypothetical protein